MYTLRYALVSVLFLFFSISKIQSQVTDVDFLIQYNPETCLYEACIVVAGGSATTYPQRIQFNAQYTIVVPTGTTLSIDTLFWPKEDNATYTGTIPCLWEFGPKEISPPAQPQHDFHTIFPNLSPPSAYDNLATGDTVRLFGLSTNAELECEMEIRPFECGSDPSSLEMPSGGDFCCGFTLGSATQLYRMNLETVHPPGPEIEYEIECNGDVTINVTPEDSLICQHPYEYVWNGPPGSGFFSTDESPVIPEPITPGLYEAVITDSYGCESTIYIQVDGVPDVTPNETICGEGTVTLEDLSGIGSGTWSLDPSNTVGAFVGGTSSGTATATFFANATGVYTFIYSGAGCDAVTEITVAPPAGVPNITDNGPLCEGDDFMLTTDFIPGAIYAWSGPNFWTSNQQNPVINGVTASDAGTYQLIVTLGPCPSSPSTTTLVIHGTPPTPTANSNSPVCEGNDILLSTDFVSGATYSWTGPNGFTSSAQNPTISGASTTDSGTYCVSIIVDGCESEQDCINVTVNPNAPNPVVSNDGPVCEGEDINLSADFVAVGTYSWTGPNGFTSNQQNPTISGVTASEVGSYCLIITVNGCPSPEECTNVALNPTPAMPIASNDGPICEGDVLTLSTDFVAGAMYSWTGPNSFTSSAQNPTISGFTSANAGTYCVVVTVNGCTSPAGCTDVMSNPTPADPTPTNDGPLCVGNDLQLFTDFVAGAMYSWTGPNGYVSTQQNPVLTDVTSVNEGNYCVVVTLNGCSSNQGCTNVTINDTPAPPVLSSNSPLCEGETLMLDGPTIAGASYVWRDPDNIFFSSMEDPTIANITPAEAGLYCLVVTVNGCDSPEECINVEVTPTPATPIVSSNSPICPGEDVLLFTDEVPGATYTWTGPTSIVSNDQNAVYTGASAIAGTYCLVITEDGCDSEEVCTDIVIKTTPLAPSISSNTPLCEGNDILLTADFVAGATYNWTGPNGYVSTEQNPIITNITEADHEGTYILTIEVDGCSSPSISTNVSIFPTPATPSPTYNGPICDGEDIELAVDEVPGANYIWSGPNGFISFQQNPIISPATLTDAGDYCVVISLNGCDSEQGCVTVDVKENPATPTVSNDGPICDGEDITLSTPTITDATYAWTGPNGYTSTEQNPTLVGATPTESGSYCLVISLNGCDSEQACTDIEIIENPATPTVSNDGPICDGEDITLSTPTVTGATYAWTGPNGYTSTEQNPTIVGATPTESGSYCLVITVNGCDSEQACTDIEIKENPETPTVSNDGPICDGEDITLSTPTVTDATYAWTGPNGYTSTEQNPTLIGATPTQSGSYCVTITVNGCDSEQACTDIEIIDNPATPTVSNDGPICDGEDITLSTPTVPNATYTWSGPNGYTSTEQNPTLVGATPTESGSYCVVVTVNGCDSEQACIDIEIIENPATPTVSNDGPICDGEDITLSTPTVTGATYAWTGPNGYTSTEQNPTIVGATPTESGSYCVVVTVNGCDSEQACTDIEIKENPATPTASNDGPICDGEDITLSTPTVTDASYAWTGPNGYTSTEQNPTLIGATPTESGSYCVVITVNGCDSEQACTDIEIKENPATPTVSNDGPICDGEDITLSTPTVTDATYAWTGPNGYTSTEQNPTLIGATPTESGSYCLVISVNGCDSEQACTDIEIKENPATPTVSNDGPICDGEDITLSTPTVTDATYAWTGPNGYTSTEQNPTIVGATPTESGSYCVVITVNGCHSEQACTDIEIKENPATPTVSNDGPICDGEDITLSTPTVADATYTWTGPNGYTSTEQNPTLVGATPTESGSYCVVITVNGCDSEQACTDIEVKPNPATPTVSNDGPICDGEDITLSTPTVTDATYSWTGPNGYTSTEQNPTIVGATPTESGSYCLVITVNGCDSEQACTDIEIKDNPATPIVSNNGPICEDEDIILTAGTVLGATYSWTGPNGYSSNQQNPTIVGATPTESGSYCLVVNVNGCESESACTDVEVKPTPETPIVSNNGPICENEDILLFADNVPGATYSWTGPNGYVSSQQNPIITGATTSQSGNYCLVITVNGCISETACTDVEVKPNPALPIVGNNGPICEDDDILLFADNVPGATYSWTGPNGYSSSQANPVISNATTNESGSYCLIIIVNGCASEQACTNVEVKPTPVTPFASNNGPICEDEDLLLFADDVLGATYTWSGPGGYSSSAQNPVISGATLSNDGTYCVFITVNGCVSELGCTDVEIKPTPTTPDANNNGPICEGESIELSTSFIAGATYSWSGPNGYTSNQQNPSILNATPSQSGNYCIEIIIDGCVSESACTDVEVKPNPETPVVSNNGPICEDENIELTTASVPGATYTWSGPNGYSSDQQNPVIVGATPTESGTYCLFISVNGCISEAGCTDVEVKPTPETPDANNNGPICEDENIELATSAVPGATYSWTGPNGYTSDQQNPTIIGATPTESGSYCVVVTVNGCVSESACTDVEVKPTPETPIVSNNGPICEDEDIELSVETVPGATYSWTGPNGYSSGQQNPVIVGATPTESGSYCVVITVNGCDSESACTDVEVKPTPETPVVSNNGPICEDENIELTTASIPGATFTWSGPNGWSSDQQNPVIVGATPTESGTYCLYITVNGCISEAGCTDVEVKPTPETPVASNNGPICEDENIELAATTVPGATYSWTGPNGYTSDQQNPTIEGATPTESGSYCVVVTVNGCDSESACTDVEVKPTPETPIVSNNGPICEDEDIELSVETVPGATYAWTGPNGYSSDLQNPTIVGASPTESGSYCVVITVDGCESESACTDVEVKPTPETPIVSNNGPICEGEDIELSVETVPGASYTWTGPNGYSSDLQNPTIVGASPTESGSYCVVITVDGCESESACTDVEVKPTPETPNVSNNGPICEGEDIELSVETVPGASYTWTGPNGYSSTEQNPSIVGASPTESGSYCVVITVDGCDGESACTDVEVKPTPETPIVSNNGPICEGENIELSVETVSGASYTWTGPNGYSSDLQNPTIVGASPTESGSYCVVITVDGCDSESACTDVEVKPTPETPIVSNNGPICEDENIELSVETVPGATYSWTGPNGYTSNQQNPTIAGATPTESGSYCVVITIEGCDSESACTDVEVKPTPETPVANNNGPVCEEESIEFSTGTVSGATYTWTGPNGFVSNEQNPTIEGAEDIHNGTYCLVITVNGCDSETSCTEVIVTPTPSDPIPGNNGPICEGQDLNLTTEEVPGGSYSWTGPNGFTSDLQNPTISSASTFDSGSYCVEITVDGCVSASVCTDVEIKSNPDTPTVNSNSSICEGETLELTSTPVSNAEYAWTGPNGFTSDLQNPTIAGVTPAASGSYCLVVTVDGCESIEQCTEVIISPEISAGVDQSILCAVLADIEITMAATSTSNGSWSTGSNPGSVTIGSIDSPTTTISNFTEVGIYTFIWSNGICSDEMTVEVTEMPNAGTDLYVKCDQIGTAIMSAEGNGVWSEGSVAGTYSISDVTSPIAEITDFENPGTYEFIWTIGDCSDTVIIEVDDDCQCPIANNIIDGATEIYCGQSVERFIEGEEATPAGGSYQWQYSFNGGAFQNIAASDSKDYTTEILGLGTHEFRRIYSITSPICSDTSNQVLIEVKEQPIAGDDQELNCQNLSSLEAIMNGTGTGIWNFVSGPGTATIVSNALPNTVIREFSEAGTYVFSYGSADCSDEVAITITEEANAGPDQSLDCFVTDSATMAAEGSGTWSIGSGGSLDISSMTSPNAIISNFEGAGSYELIWTVGDCSDAIVITVGEDCECPIENNEIVQPNPAQFCGESPAIEIIGTVATPDGEYNWEYSFDGGAFMDAAGTKDLQNYTTANLPVGNHRFRRVYETTDDPICIDISDIIEINVYEQPNAGDDLALECIDLPGGSVVMNGSGSGSWSPLNTNIGSASIVNSDQLNTEINGFTIAGTYGFVLTHEICSDTVFVEVSSTIDAGADQQVDCYVTDNAVMSAVSGNGTWTVGIIPSGASNPNIVSPGSPNTIVDGFDEPGTYELIWTDINTGCSDAVTLTVGEDCDCPIAGNNLIQPIPSEYCDMSPILTFEGADASPSGGSYIWEISIDGGPFMAAAGDNTQRDYTASAFGVGEIRCRRIYTIDDPMCSDTSNIVTINITETPDAGEDQLLECISLPGSTTMAGSGTGTWTTSSSNPSVATIVDANSGTTVINGLTNEGEYIFTFANGECTDEVVITVTAEADAGADQNVNCFLTGTASLTATGTGLWSYGTTTNGDQPSFNMSNASTTISGFAGAGTYEVIWTNANGCSDVMMITVGDDCTCPIGDNVITQPNPDEYCGESDDLLITGLEATPSNGSYNWEYSTDGVSFMAASSPFNQRDYQTGILGVGEHFFRRIYNLDSPECSDTSEVVSIVVYSQPDAGQDQLIECVETPATITMAGTGPGTWTENSGNPNVIIDLNSSATTEVSGLESGVYFFTFTNGICTDEVMITITEVSNAGEDQSYDCFETATAVLNAEGNGMWSWGSTPNNDQPGFDTSIANASVTGFGFEGDYELIWTNEDGCEDSMIISLGADCQCPIANNIIDQPNPNNFCGSASDLLITGMEAQPSNGTYLWQHSIDNGPFVDANGDNAQRDYTTDLLAVGNHRYRRIYIVTTPFECEDTSNIVSIVIAENANAGPDQTVDCYEDGEAIMAAIGTGTWSWTSSLTANIVSPSSPTSVVNDFPQAGEYILTWTTIDGCTDEVTITVGDDCLCPILDNTITQSDPNEFCGISDVLTIIGSDAQPAGGSYRWEYSFNAGPFVAAGNNDTERDYTTTALGVGQHVFRRVYDIDSPIDCEDISNSITIIVYEEANAGPDQTVDCYENGEVTMAAIGSGEWTWVSGITATIVSLDEGNSIINGFPQAGTYELMWTTDEGCTDNIIITVGEECDCPILENDIIQPDPNEFCGISDVLTIIGSDAQPAGGSYRWEYSFNAGPFVAAGNNDSNRDYTTTALGVGQHVFRRIYDIDSPIDCEDISSSVTIIVYEEANAGPDQTVDCYEDGEVTMAAIGSGEWTWVSGITGTIVSFGEGNSVINGFPQAGTYELMWTTDGGCTDNVVIIVGEECDCPIEANTISQPDPNEFCGQVSSITISGSQPSPAGGTYRWEYSFDGGPFISANGTFDQRDYTTGILGVGEHRFRRVYAINSPMDCSDVSDIVTIIVYEEVDAGPDQTVECYEDGIATMAAIGEGIWSWGSMLVATIDVGTDASTTIRNFPEAGLYELIWMSEDGECSDIVLINVGDDCVECEIMNNTIDQPIPSEYCEISPGMTIIGSNAFPSNGVYTWEYSFNGGPFQPASGIINQLNYSTSDLGPGEHRFRRRYLLDTNPICEDVSDIVFINVLEPVEAGENQELGCEILEDLIVNLSAEGEGEWSQSISNPDVVVISDLSDANATLSGFKVSGLYTFVWTNGICEDEMTVLIEEPKDAGEDQFVSCFIDGTATLSAEGLGTWIVGSNNPGTVEFSSFTDPNAILSNFSINGVYEFIWRVDGCDDSVLVFVEDECPCLVESNSIIDDVADVFCKTTDVLLITGNEATPAGGTYLWQISIDGSGFADAPGINNTKDYDASNFGAATYILRRQYTLNIDGVICSEVSDEIEFYVFDEKVSPGDISFTPDPVCLGDSLILEVDYNPNLMYNWEIMSGGGRVLYALDSMSMIVVESPGKITVSVTQSLEGCDNNIVSNASEIEITVLDNPKPNLGSDTTFCELDETFFIYPGEFAEYEWHDGSTKSEFEVDGEGIYTVSVMDTMGCVGTDMVNIKSFCCEFAYPNIFKADSRGKNSEFKVTDIYDCVIEAELFIYDRWGNLVFIGDKLDSWDGTFNGKFVEQGVYVFIYKYTAKDADRQEFEDEVKGDITVLR